MLDSVKKKSLAIQYHALLYQPFPSFPDQEPGKKFVLILS